MPEVDLRLFIGEDFRKLFDWHRVSNSDTYSNTEGEPYCCYYNSF
jgi:hypothetical protein